MWHGEITVPVVVAAGVALVGAVLAIGAITIASAVDVYLRTVLYRYATGRPTPGIDTGTLPPFAEPA
jgi:hypothetical protein